MHLGAFYLKTFFCWNACDYYVIIITKLPHHHYYIAVLVPPPSEVQALCSVVVWESPDALHCNNLIGFDVRLFGSPQLQQNLTRRVRSNRTYYVISDEDNLANSYETYVQVLLTYYSNPNIIYIQYHGITTGPYCVCRCCRRMEWGDFPR